MGIRVTTVMGGMSALFLMFMFIAADVGAQGGEVTGKQKNSLVKGAWALQFRIGNDFTLSSFQGTTFSLKKHTSDGSAWRLGLDLSLNLTDRDWSREIDSDLQDWDSDIDQETVRIVLQKIFYPSPAADVNFFYGFGPKAGFGHSNTVDTRDPLTYKLTREWTSWSAGASFVVGVEWFPTGRLSLLAEYGSVLQYEWQKVKDKYVSIPPYRNTTRRVYQYTDNSVQFISSKVKFGLSVYF